MISFTEAQILAWVTPVLWPFIRILALLTAMPVLGQRLVPARVRIGLAFLVALCAQAALPPQPLGQGVALDSLTGLTLVAQQVFIGLALGFAGVALLAGGEASFKPNDSGIAPLWAVLACLGATVCYALSASFTKKHIPSLPPLVTATGSQMGAALALALPALWWHPQHLPSLRAWGALLAVGIVCTGLAYILYFKLIENTGPAKALTVTFMVPVFAIVYGVVLLGERVTPWMLGCGLVVLLGTALSSVLIQWAPRQH